MMNPLNDLFGTSVSKLGMSLLVSVALLLSACGGGGGGGDAPPPAPPAPTPTLTSISITPSSSTVKLVIAATVSFTATGHYSNGTTANITNQVTWTSSYPGFATIAAGGVATGVAVGTTTVTAVLGAVTSNAATLGVISLSSLAINPASATVTEGLTTSFSATGTYSNGTTEDLTSQVTWGTGSGATATIATGVATGVAAGATTVTASLAGVNAPNANLTVVVPTVKLDNFSITSPASPVATPKGKTVAFIATGNFSDASSGDISGSVTWTSSNPAVATVDSSGVATALTLGTTIISATSGAIITTLGPVINSTNTVTLDVKAPELATLQIGPTPAAVEIGYTLPFQLSGTLTDGTAATAATWGTLNWTSSLTGIATFNTPTVGTATGVDIGTTNISVTSGVITSNTSVLTVSLKQLGGARQGKPMNLGTAPVTTMTGTFLAPSGVTTDGTNLYIADTANHVIRQMVIGTGVTTTLAGSIGFSGFQNGTGTAASFNLPEGITTDGTNVYVADTVNNMIRKIVIATGAVTTLAGSGNTGSANGTGTAASFNNPRGITVDKSGNLYVADTGNGKIRKIVIATAAVTDFVTQLTAPRGITTDAVNLYVADTGDHTIRKIVIGSATMSVLAGTVATSGSADGVGTSATFWSPQGITTDGTNLYVADTENNKIRQIVISTANVTTLAGTGAASSTNADPGTNATFNRPYGITTDGTSVFNADNSGGKIRKIN